MANKYEELFNDKIIMIKECGSDVRYNKDDNNTLTYKDYKIGNCYNEHWFQCINCGEWFRKSFRTAVRDKRFTCRNCSNKKISNAQKIDYNEVIERVLNMGSMISLDKVNLLKREEWNKVIDKYWFKCVDCGKWIYKEYRRFVGGYCRCEKCSGFRKWDLELVKKYCKDNGGEFISNEFLGINNRYKIRCNKCKQIYETTFRKYAESKTKSCFSCASLNNRSFTALEYKKYVLDNFNILCLGEYDGIDKPILHVCPKCNGDWFVSPYNIINQRSCGCMACRSSIGESIIKDYLDKLGIKYESEYKYKDRYTITSNKRFDFAILNNDNTIRLVIEFDGRQHYEPVEYFGGEDSFWDTVVRDALKNAYCEENNIKLVRIPYWEIDNIENLLNEELRENGVI